MRFIYFDKLFCMTTVNCLQITTTFWIRRRINSKACCIATVVAQITQKNRSSIAAQICFRGKVFTGPLFRNRLHIPVLLLLRACMLRGLHSNGRCLQSHLLEVGLYRGYPISSLQKLFAEVWITVVKIRYPYFVKYTLHQLTVLNKLCMENRLFITRASLNT
jgi:hypothetical protein